MPEVIYAGHNEFQDPTLNVMSEEEWLRMGDLMGGIETRGGPVTGLLRPAVRDTARTAPRREHRT